MPAQQWQRWVMGGLASGLLWLAMGNLAQAQRRNGAEVPDLNEQFAQPTNLGSRASRQRQQADRLVKEGRTLARYARYPAAIAQWQQALDLYRQLADAKSQGIVQGYLANAYTRTGQLRAAEDAARRQLAIARDLRDRQSQIFALNSLGRVLLDRNARSAAQLFLEAQELSTELKSAWGLAISHESLGRLAASLENYDEAIVHYRLALNASRRARQPELEASILNAMGQVYQTQKRYADSLRFYALALRIADMNDDRANQLRAIDGMVAALQPEARYPQILELLRQRLKVAQELGDPRLEISSHLALARAYRATGELDIAEQHYYAAIALAKVLPDAELVSQLGQELASLKE